MKIFLTGSTGLLGNNVLRELLNRGDEVRCAVRPQSGKVPKSLDGLSCEIVEVDLAGTENWSPIIEGCDAVIHAAGSIHIGWKKYELSHQINVLPTQRIAKAARELQARMIHISTVDTLANSPDGKPVSEVDREPLNPPNNYVRTKTEAENAVFSEIESGLDGFIVHPGFLIGPNDWKPSSGKMLISLSKKEIPMAPTGGCSAVDVRSVSHGICNALTKGRTGENYILGGENIHYKELFEKMSAVIGCRPPKTELRPVFAKIGMTIANFVNLFGKNEGDFNSAMIEMGQLNHFYSSEKAMTELDYQIGDLEKAISDSWEFIKAVHLN